MGIGCKIGFHKWIDCKCTVCGKTRNKHHKWNGCKCSVCGKKRDEQHSWNGCKCLICGKTRNQDHSWDGCYCRNCSETRHQWKLNRIEEDVEVTDDGFFLNGFGQCGPVIETVHYYNVYKCEECGEEYKEHTKDETREA